MKFASAISDLTNANAAAAAVSSHVRNVVGREINLAMLFLSGDHVESAEVIADRIWRDLKEPTLIGCSAEGVIAGDREVERLPGVALLAGKLDDNVEANAFHIGQDEWPGLIGDADKLAGKVHAFDDSRVLVGFGDPFSTPLQQFTDGLAKVAPGLPLVGGMASSSRTEGGNRLILNGKVFDNGLVGVTIGGAVEVETIVSQGCRPIGRPLVITKSNKNVIDTLGGKAALSVVREIVENLSDADRQLLQKGLMVGRVISEYRETFTRGDFLIRNIIGADEKTGSIAVADLVRTGQTVQFHVRDAATADEDLAIMLSEPAKAGDAIAGLLFSCNGRGCRMFEDADHDITAVRSALPATPFAGFFAAGELGPVGNQNFIHGHTASIALLRKKI